jgi:hypothetical protein
VRDVGGAVSLARLNDPARAWSSRAMSDSVTPPPATLHPALRILIGVLLALGSLPFTVMLLLAESGRRMLEPRCGFIIMLSVAAGAFCFIQFLFGSRRWLVPVLLLAGIAGGALLWGLSIAPLGQYRG